MAKLTLYKSTFCPFCIKVEKVIKDKNIEGIEFVNIDKDPEGKEYLIEKGGKKQVPCLFVDDKPMYESNDIIEYLTSL